MLFMVLVVTIGGYFLMFLFIKYYERRYMYYIAWLALVSLLGSFQIDVIQVNEIEIIFQEQFQEENWVYYLAWMMVIIPSLYVLYPFVQIYYYLMLFFKQFIDPLVHIPISPRRRDLYDKDIYDKRDKSNTGIFLFPSRKEDKHETKQE